MSSSLAIALFTFEAMASLLIFLVGSIFSFLVPGLVLLRRRNSSLSTAIYVALALVIGLVAWTYQGYIFGYLHARWLTYCYLLVMLSVYGWQTKQVTFTVHKSFSRYLKVFAKYLKKDYWAVFLSIVGVTWQLVYVWSSGWLTLDGIKLWFINFHDGIMHVAFAQELQNRFPPMQPGAVGLTLTNYHYWSDLAVAEFARIWGVSVMPLTFQLFPLFLSVVGVFCLYGLMLSIGGNRQTARWALFFYFFAGNLGWLFMLLMHQSFGASLPVIDHGLLLFSNPPQAFAKIVFLATIWLLDLGLKTKRAKFLYLAAILTASLFGFKIYFGIFAVIGWTCFVLVELALFGLKRHSNKQVDTKMVVHTVLAAITSAILVLLIYVPVNRAAGGLYYVPLAWPKLLIDPTNLNWSDWWLCPAPAILHR